LRRALLSTTLTLETVIAATTISGDSSAAGRRQAR